MKRVARAQVEVPLVSGTRRPNSQTITAAIIAIGVLRKTKVWLSSFIILDIMHFLGAYPSVK